MQSASLSAFGFRIVALLVIGAVFIVVGQWRRLVGLGLVLDLVVRWALAPPRTAPSAPPGATLLEAQCLDHAH